MGFIQGLHGTVALGLAVQPARRRGGWRSPTSEGANPHRGCLLIATGGLDPGLFLPLAVVRRRTNSST
jgi:hypothetical protein